MKGKALTESVSHKLLSGEITFQEVLLTLPGLKDPAKATCVEALEFATRVHPEWANRAVLETVTALLEAKAPRIKWESAKVIANIASRFPEELDEAVTGLLRNTTHVGTVVRWSAAFALGEIVKLAHPRSAELAVRLEEIAANEEKNSIRKIYQTALNKRKK